MPKNEILLDDKFISNIKDLENSDDIIRMFKESYNLDLSEEEIINLCDEALKKIEKLKKDNQENKPNSILDENLSEVKGGLSQTATNVFAVTAGICSITTLIINTPKAIESITESFKKVKNLLKKKK